MSAVPYFPNPPDDVPSRYPFMSRTTIGTVTLHTAVFPPSFVFTVMSVLPPPTAVTRPLALTVATAVLLLVHVTDLSFAFDGLTVAVSCFVSPFFMVAEVAFRLTPVTPTSDHTAYRVTSLFSVYLPPGW